MGVKCFLILLIVLSSAKCFCQIDPSGEDLNEMSKMTSSSYTLLFVGHNNDYDRTKYYLEYFKYPMSNKSKPIACFVYYINPTWDHDRHFQICDCKPLDSALNIARKKYFKTHPKK